MVSHPGGAAPSQGPAPTPFLVSATRPDGRPVPNAYSTYREWVSAPDGDPVALRKAADAFRRMASALESEQERLDRAVHRYTARWVAGGQEEFCNLWAARFTGDQSLMSPALGQMWRGRFGSQRVTAQAAFSRTAENCRNLATCLDSYAAVVERAKAEYEEAAIRERVQVITMTAGLALVVVPLALPGVAARVSATVGTGALGAFATSTTGVLQWAALAANLIIRAAIIDGVPALILGGVGESVAQAWIRRAVHGEDLPTAVSHVDLGKVELAGWQNAAFMAATSVAAAPLRVGARSLLGPVAGETLAFTTATTLTSAGAQQLTTGRVDPGQVIVDAIIAAATTAATVKVATALHNRFAARPNVVVRLKGGVELHGTPNADGSITVLGGMEGGRRRPVGIGRIADGVLYIDPFDPGGAASLPRSGYRIVADAVTASPAPAAGLHAASGDPLIRAYDLRGAAVKISRPVTSAASADLVTTKNRVEVFLVDADGRPRLLHTLADGPMGSRVASDARGEVVQLTGRSPADLSTADGQAIRKGTRIRVDAAGTITPTSRPADSHGGSAPTSQSGAVESYLVRKPGSSTPEHPPRAGDLAARVRPVYHGGRFSGYVTADGRPALAAVYDPNGGLTGYLTPDGQHVVAAGPRHAMATAGAIDAGPGAATEGARVVRSGPARVVAKLEVTGPFLHLPERWKDVPAFIRDQAPTVPFGAGKVTVQITSRDQMLELAGGSLVRETETTTRVQWQHRTLSDVLVQKVSVGAEHGRAPLSGIPLPEAVGSALRNAQTFPTPAGVVRVEWFVVDEFKPTGTGPQVTAEWVTRRTTVVHDATGTLPKTWKSLPERRSGVLASAPAKHQNEFKIGLKVSLKPGGIGPSVLGLQPAAKGEVAVALKGATAVRWLELVENGFDVLKALGRALADPKGVVEIKGVVGIEYRLVPEWAASLLPRIGEPHLDIGQLPGPLGGVEHLAASIEPAKIEASAEIADVGNAIQSLASRLGLPVDKVKQLMGITDGQILPRRGDTAHARARR